MSIMVPLTDYLMVALLLMLYLMETLGSSQCWHKTNVSTSLLDLETPQTSQAIRDLHCGIKSAHDPSINIFCFMNAGICQQYKTVVQTWQDPEAGPVTECWSRNIVPQPLGCDYDGVSVNHGDLLEDDIYPLKCWNGNMTKIPGFNYPNDCEFDGSVYRHGDDDNCYYKCDNGTMNIMILNHTTGNQCVPPFEIYNGACYYYGNTGMSWCQARQWCRDQQADLPIASDDFNTLKDFFLLKQESYEAWIGIRNIMWLDGQTPDPSLWRSGEPGELDHCGDVSVHNMWDEPCDKAYHFICQLF